MILHKSGPKARRLERLATLVDGVLDDAGRNPVPVSGLIAKLEQDEGLRITYTGGAYQARMAAVAARSTVGRDHALRHWARAARRKVQQMEAQ